jgi:exonuclease III
MQVVIVGDFNIAAEKRDVHDALSWDTMYHPSELQALQALMGPEGSNCRDTWRVLHPQTDGVYTVWNEKTSARAFNVVGVQGGRAVSVCVTVTGVC